MGENEERGVKGEGVRRYRAVVVVVVEEGSSPGCSRGLLREARAGRGSGCGGGGRQREDV